MRFVLDGIHEAINRARTDRNQIEVAKEDDAKTVDQMADKQWRQFTRRNRSVITDLFYFNVKSTLKCSRCGWDSHTFQAYSSLPLDLPPANSIHFPITVIFDDPTKPMTRYSFKLPESAAMGDLIQQLSETTSIPVGQWVVADIFKHHVFALCEHNFRLADLLEKSSTLYAYQLSLHTFPHPSLPAINARDQPDNDVEAKEPKEKRAKKSATVTLIHRSVVPDTVTLLGKSKIVRFGIPLMIGGSPYIELENLYELVWCRVARYFACPPEFVFSASAPNRPFVLKGVAKTALFCGSCPWINACSGCELVGEARDGMRAMVNLGKYPYLAIEWNGDFLNRYYDVLAAEEVYEDVSVQENEQVQSRPLAITDAAAHFIEPEKLEYKCEQCRSSQQFSKQLSLWTYPRILLVHLKRFSFDGSKVNTFVKFPLDGLDLSSMLAAEVAQRGLAVPPIYDLYAVSNHLGRGERVGHYITFVKSRHDQQWYCFDDENCREMEAESVCSPDAYILFYRLRGASPWLDMDQWSLEEEVKQELRAWNGSAAHQQALSQFEAQPAQGECVIL
eukprot:TRINITY_DN2029_c0_g1_i14.p1 TRINITY_DN2029_c0_g1~~TRINITY_DN2029_c0_g1_i14.p1  ORF type:complete len:561 (+),score=118.53 TRINITY_DN2029_c0_g1_i14:118-1800(+)